MISASQYKGLEFYQNLAKLFYAIAAADKVVKEEEFNALKKSITQDWLSIEVIKDEINTNPSYQMDILLDWLHEEQKPIPEKCFNDFISYAKKYPNVFTSTIKSLILKTARMIASSFSGVNKSELIMLARLDVALKKIESNEE